MTNRQGNKRSKAQRDAERAEIARGTLHGASQRELAAEFGVTQPQINYDLKKIRQEWRDRAAATMDMIMAQELARIDEMERQAWGAWFRTLEPIQRKSQWAKPDSDGTPTPSSAVVHTDPGFGDTRYMNIIQWCVEQRLRIYGIYKKDPGISLTVNGLANFNVQAMEESEINDEILRLTRIAMEQTQLLETGVIIDVTPERQHLIADRNGGETHA